VVVNFEICSNDRRMSDVEREAALACPGFGQVFTDHMVTLRWTEGRGWHDGRLEPYGSFTLPPATSVFHYGQAVFEGMKAYRHDSGSIALFRPRANAERFNRSAQRLAMPELPVDIFVHAVEQLVIQDRDWVPEGEGKSLYLRPFMIATQPGLGFTHPSSSYLFCVIASPAAPYFGQSGPTAVTVWLSEDYVRAAPGGTGAAKAAGNYAAAFVAGRQATSQGCDQVVWLDAAQHTWVEEMGGMNLFFVYGGARARIMTPRLTGALLPGITRDSLLTLASEFGIGAEEGKISTNQWRQQCESGEMTEVFACGTAAVIAPVGAVKSRSGGWQVGDGRPGPVMLHLREELLTIQYGRGPDPYHWVYKVC
jgi:branched-chain amino acid aminotransferase